jgi:anti-anti-sigma factor
MRTNSSPGRASADARAWWRGLEHCEFIDPIALAALLRAHDRAEKKSGSLVMAAPTAQVRRVLQVSGLETQDLVFNGVEGALAGFARLV